MTYKTAAITITYNRLAATKKTVKSFYAKTSVDFHLFIDNGSTDGTQEWLLESGYQCRFFPENVGITKALKRGLAELGDYDFILKLDNDIKVLTPDIINYMLSFYEKAGKKYVTAPIDTKLDPNYHPNIIWQGKLLGYDVMKTSHVGGAFMLMPNQAAMTFLKSDAVGDLNRGYFFQKIGFEPTYLKDIFIEHFGITNQTKDYKF